MRAGFDSCLMKRVRRRQLKFLGHMVRAAELQSDCLIGRNDGTRARGSQRTTYSWTASWVFLVEARGLRVPSDWQGRDEARHPWSTITQDSHSGKVR